jgi:hypothetical protein
MQLFSDIFKGFLDVKHMDVSVSTIYHNYILSVGNQKMEMAE